MWHGGPQHHRHLVPRECNSQCSCPEPRDCHCVFNYSSPVSVSLGARPRGKSLSTEVRLWSLHLSPGILSPFTFSGPTRLSDGGWIPCPLPSPFHPMVSVISLESQASEMATPRRRACFLQLRVLTGHTQGMSSLHQEIHTSSGLSPARSQRHQPREPTALHLNLKGPHSFFVLGDT